MIRVLTVVCRPVSLIRPASSIPARSSSARSSAPSLSAPTAPASVHFAPSATTLAATFAAPPSARHCSSTRTTGTGASGDMRDALPWRYTSSITSPTTSTRTSAACSSNSSRRFRLSPSMGQSRGGMEFVSEAARSGERRSGKLPCAPRDVKRSTTFGSEADGGVCGYGGATHSRRELGRLRLLHTRPARHRLHLRPAVLLARHPHPDGPHRRGLDPDRGADRPVHGDGPRAAELRRAGQLRGGHLHREPRRRLDGPRAGPRAVRAHGRGTLRLRHCGGARLHAGDRADRRPAELRDRPDQEARDAPTARGPRHAPDPDRHCGPDRHRRRNGDRTVPHRHDRGRLLQRCTECARRARLRARNHPQGLRHGTPQTLRLRRDHYTDGKLLRALDARRHRGRGRRGDPLGGCVLRPDPGGRLLHDAGTPRRARAGVMMEGDGVRIAHDDPFPAIRRELAEDREQYGDPQTHGAVIRLEDVHLTFEEPILSGVSLEARRGETLMVAGESGSGKSTILKLILRLLVPDSGRIEVLGRHVIRLSFEEALDLRRHIGMVFQNAALFDSMTIFENVAYPLRENRDLEDDELERIVRERLEFVDLEPQRVMHQLPSQLSGGMRKRVGIARAIATDPEVVLYDEPTAGLDPLTIGTINDLIRKLQRELKVTSVIVTHDIRAGFRVAQRVNLLRDGKIVFDGSPEDMIVADDPYIQRFLS